MNQNSWVKLVGAAVLVILVAAGLLGYSRYLANSQATPPAKVVPKKATSPTIRWRVGQLEHRVTALEGRVTKFEQKAVTPVLPAPASVAAPATPVPPTPHATAVKSADNGWYPVLTNGQGAIMRFGTSTVPPPKVPVKPAPEGTDR